MQTRSPLQVNANRKFCICVQDVTPLQIVFPDTALRLQALLDFKDEGGVQRVAGDEWLFEGPGNIFFIVFFSCEVDALELGSHSHQ